MSNSNLGGRIESSFTHLDETMLKSGAIRDVLIDKLFNAAKEYEFKLGDKSAEDRESFMAVINSLDGLLKGKEKVALDNVKLSLMQRSESDNHSSAAVITQLLHMINPLMVGKINNPLDHVAASRTLEAEFNTTGEKISEAEAEHIES